jgi:Flp pilus assembly CpaF family ATPase
MSAAETMDLQDDVLVVAGQNILVAGGTQSGKPASA